MPFPTEKCTFLQKNAVLGGRIAGNRRKSQEGFRDQELITLANFHKKNTIFNGILEPQKWLRPKARLLKHDFPIHGKCCLRKSGVGRRVVFQKGGFGGCSSGTKSGTRVPSDVPRNENRNKGTFACSPGMKNRNEGSLSKTTFYETGLLSPLEKKKAKLPQKISTN